MGDAETGDGDGMFAAKRSGEAISSSIVCLVAALAFLAGGMRRAARGGWTVCLRRRSEIPSCMRKAREFLHTA